MTDQLEKVERALVEMQRVPGCGECDFPPKMDAIIQKALAALAEYRASHAGADVDIIDRLADAMRSEAVGGQIRPLWDDLPDQSATKIAFRERAARLVTLLRNRGLAVVEE